MKTKSETSGPAPAIAVGGGAILGGILGFLIGGPIGMVIGVIYAAPLVKIKIDRNLDKAVGNHAMELHETWRSNRKKGEHVIETSHTIPSNLFNIPMTRTYTSKLSRRESRDN